MPIKVLDNRVRAGERIIIKYNILNEYNKLLQFIHLIVLL